MCPARRKLWWPWWLLLGAVLALILGLGSRRPLPTVVILPLEQPRLSPAQRSLEQGWSWLQLHLPGHHSSVLLRARIILGRGALRSSDVGLGAAASEGPGIRIWLFTPAELASVKQRLQDWPNAAVLSEPGIQSLAGMRAAMTAGSTINLTGKPEFAGLELNSLPRIRHGRVDLTSQVKFTEAITNQLTGVALQTNLAVRTRIQIPPGGGALLLADLCKERTMAVLLSAQIQ